MRVQLFYLLLFKWCWSSGQLTQLPTGSQENLDQISVIDGVLMINGESDYLVKSYDGGETLLPLANPVPQGFWKEMMRLDTSTVFLMGYTAYAWDNVIYRSLTGGLTWQKMLDTTALYLEKIAFFDTLNGLGLGFWDRLLTTCDGGKTFTSTTIDVYSGTMVKTVDDSTVCFGGGLSGANAGTIHISEDRGKTISGNGNLGSSGPKDLFLFNRDTIFIISFGGELIRTFDGGKNWVQKFPGGSLFYSNAITFRNKHEGYIVGSLRSYPTQSLGIIYKTTDLGDTWQMHNTGIETRLTDMVFLNDSVALLTGTNGVLLKWNFKKTAFTDVGEPGKSDRVLRLFPNPAKDFLNIHLPIENPGQYVIRFYDALGREVLQQAVENGLKTGIDVREVPAGVYMAEMEWSGGKSRGKVIKE